MQALPWAETPSEAGSYESWLVTMYGIDAVTDILQALLAADMSARAAVLCDGNWDLAAQQFRSADAVR